VIAILTEAKYRPRAIPLTVASVPFSFAAVLVGTGNSPDLIVVVDTVEESDEIHLRQKINGLGRALDVAGSKRPLTAVLVGPKPSDLTLYAIGRVCRVLPVGTPTGKDADTELHDWLAVLLPLPLPDPSQAIADPQGELSGRLPPNLDPELRDELLVGAAGGAAAVREALGRMLARPLSGVERYEGA
jgi:hypothetical protein